MQQEEKIYGGTSRVIATKYGEMTTVTQSKKDLENLLFYLSDNNLEWVTLKIKEKKNKVAGKPTHYLQVDTWRPEKTEEKKFEPTDELEF